ncbi:trigger factor [Haematomicrobium sanguinis]|uniref:trigger factor n=1 Tax=Haematomicrobium sanguinis TaxID=479106 RepID=UPI00068B8F1D|nr:trigger factor [Haematomicrobium sanguinis]
MKSAVENLTPTRVKLNVEVPLEELKPHIDQAYKSIAEQIQVPGFRKGKVPTRIIDQRVGRGYVLETAINEGLNDFYQAAVAETEIRPLSRPEVEITEVPDPTADSGELKFSVELETRPEIDLPDYTGLDITVDAIETDEADVDAELDALRSRFGTLKPVDRPAAADDFVTINLAAKIDGEEVDSAEGLSYQIGTGNMLDGMDEALTGLSADEDATFDTKLVGGEHAGEDASVTVKVTAVKERELPEANDDFAQLASEFDTIEELRESLAEQAKEQKIVGQGIEARDKVIDKLVELVDVPVPDSVIEEQVEQHFSGPGAENAEADHDTEEHRAEVRKNTESAFRNELILDAIADKEDLQVSQPELIEYIVTMASQYGMEPQQFAQVLEQSGQVPMMIGEVRRRKALSTVLESAKVVDTNGDEVDLSSFVTPSVSEEDLAAAEGADLEAAEGEAGAEAVATEVAEGTEDAQAGKDLKGEGDADDPANIKF